MNYSELQTTILDWSNRANLASKAPEFIRMAESALRRELRNREQSFRGVLDTVAGQEYYTFPTGYKSMVELNVCVDGKDYPVRNGAKEVLTKYNVAGVPQFFTEQAQHLRLSPIPDSDYVIDMTYQIGFESLSDTDNENWLLTNYEDLYIAGCLKFLSAYVKDYEAAKLWGEEFQSSLNDLIENDLIDRFSGSTFEVVSG